MLPVPCARPCLPTTHTHPHHHYVVQACCLYIHACQSASAACPAHGLASSSTRRSARRACSGSRSCMRRGEQTVLEKQGTCSSSLHAWSSSQHVRSFSNMASRPHHRRQFSGRPCTTALASQMGGLISSATADVEGCWPGKK